MADAAEQRIEHVPDAWQARIDGLVELGQRAKAIELLRMWARQYALTPWVYRRLGALLLAEGRHREAGHAWFWAGERGDPRSEELVARFLHGLRRRPHRVAASLPRRARVPLCRVPQPLRDELLRLGVTDAVMTKTDPPVRRVAVEVLGALLAVCLVVFLVVGAWVSLRTVFGWLRGMLP